MSSYTATAINSLLVTESGRIGEKIYRKKLNSSHWSKLVKQEQWPDEFGTAVSVMTLERSLPANALTWATLGYNPAGDATSPQTGGTDEGNCLPPNQTITFAQTLRSFNLKQTSLNSAPICVNDLRFPFQRKQQLGAMFDVLSENTVRVWDNRYRDEYFRNCGHKVILKNNAGSLVENTTTTVDPNVYTVSGTLFPTQAPAGYLTQAFLNNIALRLMRDGAGDGALTKNEGQPVFGLVCSPETSDQLIKDNADIRQDIRWVSSKAQDLLAPLGVSRVFRNYTHLVDFECPRYDYIAGQGFIRRPFYASTAATYGNKFDPNPDYESAAYEVSFVFHQDVFASMVPGTITAPGGNTKFDPQMYRGEFTWRNILDKDSNPDGNNGFFRAVYQSASKPIRPEWGYAIMHQRCRYNDTIVACTAS